MKFISIIAITFFYSSFPKQTFNRTWRQITPYWSQRAAAAYGQNLHPSHLLMLQFLKSRLHDASWFARVKVPGMHAQMFHASRIMEVAICFKFNLSNFS